LVLALGTSSPLTDSQNTAPVTLTASHSATTSWIPPRVAADSRIADFKRVAGFDNILAAAPNTTGWQKWGAWKQVRFFKKVPFKAMCRNYAEAVADGNRLLITSSVVCNHTYYAAIYSSVFDRNRTKSKFCQRIPANEPCVLSYYVDNPGGSQDFGVVTSSNYGGDQIPSVALHFRA
jgi:hypothetical protein